jgi:hypothetical protein
MFFPEFDAGNIFKRPNYLPNVGDKLDGHTHHFDHVTTVYHGAIHIRAYYLFYQFECASCQKVWESKRADRTCPACGGDDTKQTARREQFIAERDVYSPRPGNMLNGWVTIYKDVCHEITAIEPETIFFCDYAHRDAQGRIVEKRDGWGAATAYS